MWVSSYVSEGRILAGPSKNIYETLIPRGQPMKASGKFASCYRLTGKQGPLNIFNESRNRALGWWDNRFSMV